MIVPLPTDPRFIPLAKVLPLPSHDRTEREFRRLLRRITIKEALK